MKNFNAIFILLITAISLQSNLVGMYGEEESADELAPLLGQYPHSDKLIQDFQFTNEQIINFLHAVEAKKDINSYLKNLTIIDNWRVLAAARDIAKKVSAPKLQSQLSTILKQKYNLE